MQRRDLVNTAVKIFLFSLVALFVLFAGYIATAKLWRNLNGRYASPETGYYYGSVLADFSDAETGQYWLRFEGKSQSQWYWQRPTNFVYKHLDLQIYSFSDEPNDREIKATVELPSLRFRTANTNATLSSELLAKELLRHPGTVTNGLQQMETIMGFIRAAGEGKLPGPNHHGHYFEKPVNTKIMHFHLGRGFGWTVYAWLKIWGILVVFAAWRVFKKHVPTKEPALATN